MLLESDAANLAMAIVVFCILFLSFCLLIWEMFIYPLYFPALAIANLQSVAPAPRIPVADIPMGVRVDVPTMRPFVSTSPNLNINALATAPSFRLMHTSSN